MTDLVSAIGLPHEEAIRFFRQTVNVPTARWTDLMDEAHAHGFAVAGAASEGLLQDFRAAVDKAISQGTGLGEFRKDFDRIVKTHGWSHTGEAGWRARVIYETNLATAFSAGRYAQMTEPATLAAFPYWEYIHTPVQHPRPMHVAWDGMVLRADDGFWATNYPPNGWGCRCVVGVVSEGAVKRRGLKVTEMGTPATRPWRNPSTGEEVQVPVGVDPGFAYNPGQAWKEGAAPRVKAPDLVKSQPPPEGAEHPEPVEWPSLEDADKALKEATDPWAESLSADEAGAVTDFKVRYGRRINQVLRGERNEPALVETAAVLQAALMRAAMPETVRIWRGASAAEIEWWGTHRVARAFVSGSLNHAEAERYAARAVAGRVIEIIVPKGQPGAAYIHPFPEYRYPQHELLLNVGTRLRILVDDGKRLVMEAFGAGDAGP